MVTVEVGDYRGHVLLVFSDDQDQVQIVMTPDEARGLVNNLGAAIKCVSRAGVMT